MTVSSESLSAVIKARPICCSYKTGDLVGLNIITPEIPSICTPSFSLSTQNNNFNLS